MNEHDFETYINFKFKKFVPLHGNGIEIFLDKLYPANLDKKLVPSYHFKIRVKNEIAGHINFRAGNSKQILNYDGHIGYEVLPLYRGDRISQKAAKLILPFVKEHGFSSIVLTCSPENLASTKIIKGLGGKFIATRNFPGIASLSNTTKNLYQLEL